MPAASASTPLPAPPPPAANGIGGSCASAKTKACTAYAVDGTMWKAQGEAKLRAACESNGNTFASAKACPAEGSVGTCRSMPQGMLLSFYKGSEEAAARSPQAFSAWCRDVQGGSYEAP
jgi:hypothetical protein